MSRPKPTSVVFVVALLGAAVLLAFLVLGGGSRGHDVYATVPKATGVLTGQQVRAAGTPVGTIADITPVDGGRAARIKVHLEDDTAWPLPQGSRFTLRWGGTINLYNRYVELTRGQPGPTMVSEGGTLPAGAFKVPVEYGELLSVFDKRTRGDLKDLLDQGGLALDTAGPELNRALGPAPGALAEADSVLSQLDDSGQRLATLVRSTDRVTSAVNRSDPGLGELIAGAGTTLDALGDEAGMVQQTLSQAPGTLQRARGTLTRAEPTLRAVQRVTDRIGPGVTQLRRIASPLNSTLTTLTTLGAPVRQTLRAAGDAAPDITKLATRVGDVSPQLGSIGSQADVALNCIRPYAPEIASFGTLWGSALSNSDGRDKYIRALPSVFLQGLQNGEQGSSADAVNTLPGLQYAFPRPPGTQAGQPWFLDECGAGKDALDPTKDPEARSFGSGDYLPTDPGTKGGK